MNRVTDPAGTLDDHRQRLRQAAYLLLALTALAHATGRIGSVHSVHLQRQPSAADRNAAGTAQRGGGEVRLVTSPLLSANDRSRWSTIRALVDHGTFAIDRVVLHPDTRRPNPSWYTIDMVRHRGADGKEHYYSSKPPLLPVMVAGLYWSIKQVTGAGLEDYPFYVVRLILVLVNVVPLAVYFWLLGRLVERHGGSDFGRLLVMATAAWGTFLTTFAVTLNNHLPAAISVLVALSAALPVWREQDRSWYRFAVAGLFAAFAAANELPALSFLVALGAGLLWKAPLRTLSGYLPAALLVVAALLGTNYLAHQSWRLPYMHRDDGPVVAEMPAEETANVDLAKGPVPEALRRTLARQEIDISGQAQLLPSDSPDRWILWDREGHDRLAVCREGERIRIKAWDDWYEYAGSYWTRERKVGVDQGEPSRAVYAWHMLLGHHGFFSLTPVWLIGLLGIAVGLANRKDPLRAVLLLALVLTVVCVAFYIARPLKDRNYGGVASGFRWLFWLIPLWLLATLRGADRLARHKWWVALALAALAVSVFSAAYAGQNPWSHPWLFDYWQKLGWIQYYQVEG